MLAADVELVKDLNPAMTPRGHQPYGLTELNGVIYYAATDSASGYELWRSDGTAAGTYLFQDLNVGSASSGPAHLTNIDGTLYFTANVGSFGRELWKSDGTAEGTVMVVNAVADSQIGLFNQDIPTSGPLFTQVGETVFFRAYTGAHGLELWKTDGTAAGTSLVKDVVAGGAGSALGSFVAVGSTLYFTVNDGTQSAELWKSDGTDAGTVRIDVPAGVALADINELTAFGGELYFSATNANDAAFWKVSATSGSVVQVVDLWPGVVGGNPDHLTVAGDSLYFYATTSSGGGLWKLSDGGAPEEIRGGLSNGLQSLENVQGELFYSWNGSVWKSNGEIGGDVLVASPDGLSYAFRSDGTNVYFFSNSVFGKRRLWVASGDPENAIELFATTEGASHMESQLILAESGVVFAGAASSNDSELWFSDGTFAGTTKLADRLAGVGGHPVEFVRIGDIAYFSAWDGLWKTDGTAEGTVRVKALSMAAQVPMRLSTGYSAAMNGILYFVARGTGQSGYQLWRSDGTDAGTYVVKTINPTGDAILPYDRYSPGDTSPYLTAVGDLLYFRATDGVNDLELWRTDGTAVGTFALTNVNTTSTKSAFKSSSQYFALSFTVAEGKLYFRATNGVTGQGMGLWKTDGTVAGTTRLGLAPNNGPYSPEAIDSIGDDVYFMGSLGGSGYGVRKYESASGEVTLIKNVASQGSPLEPIQFRVAGGFLYFTSSVVFSGRLELWRTDGTSEGLVKLFSVPSEIYADQGFTQFATVGDELYFLRTVYGTTGVQLWRSGGDPENTLLVDASVGSANLKSSSTGPLYFVRHGAITSPNLAGLYVSDGTAEGTTLVANHSAEYGYTIPTEFVILNNRMIFTAYSERFGNELWGAALPPAPAIPGDFDRNGRVDGADFLRWQRTFGASVNYAGAGADADVNRQINGDDLPAWIDYFGATVTPAMTALEEQSANAVPLSLPASLPTSATTEEAAPRVGFAAGRISPQNWFLTLDDVKPQNRNAETQKPAEPLWLMDEKWSSLEPISQTISQFPTKKIPTTVAEDRAKNGSARPDAEQRLSSIWEEAFRRL